MEVRKELCVYNEEHVATHKYMTSQRRRDDSINDLSFSVCQSRDSTKYPSHQGNRMMGHTEKFRHLKKKKKRSSLIPFQGHTHTL